jgi:hypothetical protein
VKTGDKNRCFSVISVDGSGNNSRADPDSGLKEGISGVVMEYIPEELLIIRYVFHRKQMGIFPASPKAQQLSTVSTAPMTMTN